MTRENGSPAIFPTRRAICWSRSSRRSCPRDRRAPLMLLGVFDGPSDDALPQDRRPQTNGPIFDVRATWSFEDYEKRFDRLHRHLREGDCYQANLTFPVEAQWTGDPLSAFDALVERQPVKYGALVRSRRADRAVALAGTVLRDRRRGLDRDASDEGHRAARQDAGRGRGAEAIPAPTTRRTRPRTA